MRMIHNLKHQLTLSLAAYCLNGELEDFHDERGGDRRLVAVVLDDAQPGVAGCEWVVAVDVAADVAPEAKNKK